MERRTTCVAAGQSILTDGTKRIILADRLRPNTIPER